MTDVLHRTVETLGHDVDLGAMAGGEHHHLTHVLASAQVVERLGQATLGDGHALEEIERHRAVVQSDDDDRHACRRSLALTN